ncbi:MAG: SDR family NAD(P)-dependent oxidoreductase [Alphaproteobacteria bacterium]|nr:SDR family NAD(P)-dependent oxidoreductase [Alphaproteobacteria bacterium]
MTAPNETTKRLEGRIALITGASRGIGAAVAKAYAGEGAHVILLARTVGGLEEVDDAIQQTGGKATLLPFDLSETHKIAAIGPTVAERFGKLDILVGNAGVLGALSPVALSDPKSYENVFRVNYFANYHLIRTLDPLLRAGPAGRAIFVTAEAAHKQTPFWSAYAASKIALENMAATYAAEVAYSKLKVNIIDPGKIGTGLRREAFPVEDVSQLPAPESVTERFIELAAEGWEETGKIVAAA